MQRTASHVMRHKRYFRRKFYAKDKTLKFSRTLARLKTIPISAYVCPEIDKKRLRHVLKWLPKF